MIGDTGISQYLLSYSKPTWKSNPHGNENQDEVAHDTADDLGGV